MQERCAAPTRAERRGRRPGPIRGLPASTRSTNLQVRSGFVGPEAARGDIRPASIVGARENSANSDARAARGATRCGVSRVSRLPIPAGWASTGATCGRRTGMPERPAGPRYPGFPGASAPRHPGVPASRRPGVAASRRPGVAASRRPGIPASQKSQAFRVSRGSRRSPRSRPPHLSRRSYQPRQSRFRTHPASARLPATGSRPQRLRLTQSDSAGPRPSNRVRQQCCGGSHVGAAAVRRRQPCGGGRAPHALLLPLRPAPLRWAW